MPYLRLQRPPGWTKGSKLKYHEFWRASVFLWLVCLSCFFCLLFFLQSCRYQGWVAFCLVYCDSMRPFSSRVLLDAGGFGIHIGSGVIDCCLFRFTCLFELAFGSLLDSRVIQWLFKQFYFLSPFLKPHGLSLYVHVLFSLSG